jgi:glycosyltransferase involved in cell wall biosynthesis
MKLRQYDIVHARSSKGGFIGRIAAKLCGIKTVYTPHGFYFLNSGDRIASKFFLSLEQFAGHLTDCLIAVSDSERKEAVKNRIISEKKIVVIPNGVDSKDFLPDTRVRERVRAELNIAPTAFVVGIVSRYVPQKDPLTLVKAAQLVLTNQPEARFIWCGEGEMQEETKALARKLGIHDAFYFLGFRRDVKDIMNAFDLFALSSIFEGLPNTLLEAMALGLPVVATDVVGSKDVVINGETGVLVPPRQPERLAQGILELLADHQRRQEMGQKGQQAVRNRYSIEKMVADVEKVYQLLA